MPRLIICNGNPHVLQLMVIDCIYKTRKNFTPCAVIISEWRACFFRIVDAVALKIKVSQSNESEVDKTECARCLVADGYDPTAGADGACGRA